MNYYIVNGKVCTSDELFHYGVLGMKWGVRKGTLYGETRDIVGNNYTDYQKKRIRSQAKSILKKQIKSNDNIAEMYTKSAALAKKKTDKLVRKSEARRDIGDEVGFQKYQSKAWKQIAKYVEATNTTNTAKRRSRLAQTRLDDINQEKIKAGKDYVTNMRYSKSFILPYFTIEKEIIFKRNK